MLSTSLCITTIGKAVPYVEQTAAHGSVLTILAISFERYYAICHPLKAGYTCTQMRALAIIAVVWLVASLLTTPVFLTVHYRMAETRATGELVPVCMLGVKELWQKIYYLAAVGLFYALPFAVLLVVYGHIARHLMAGSRMLASSSEETMMRARKQVVFMLAAVMVSFFVCLLPFRILTVWLILSPEESVMDLGMETYYSLLYFCRLLCYMNAALNPILYNAISSKFRNSAIRLLRCSGVRGRLTRQITKGTTTSSTATTSGSVKQQLRVSVNTSVWNAGPKPEDV
ncbi:thyrotropin-releasing hormone receptor [Caerostris darwini]|uniref:Thyrotropin-releasing hormone receptor n=1 Tax=Caerostris darwini TaxID=1538125 RepID=A0AAV4TVS8_9ARAC|nr:thyrotropin-releasing hormone receptor [Caerostris darwini]